MTTSILNAALDAHSSAAAVAPQPSTAMEAQDAAALPQSTTMEAQDAEGKIYQIN